MFDFYRYNPIFRRREFYKRKSFKIIHSDSTYVTIQSEENEVYLYTARFVCKCVKLEGSTPKFQYIIEREQDFHYWK